MELKGAKTRKQIRYFRQVPNLPCGVESLSKNPQLRPPLNSLFLICRVELKDNLAKWYYGLWEGKFLICRVELKEFFGYYIALDEAQFLICRVELKDRHYVVFVRLKGVRKFLICRVELKETVPSKGERRSFSFLICRVELKDCGSCYRIYNFCLFLICRVELKAACHSLQAP